MSAFRPGRDIGWRRSEGTRPHDIDDVRYIFHRGQQVLRVEITGNRAEGYSIVVTEPGGLEQRKQFPSSGSAHARWAELQEFYRSAGWLGPAILD